MGYNFDDIISTIISTDNILLDEKSYQNILNYDVAYKAQYFKKSLLIFMMN